MVILVHVHSENTQPKCVFMLTGRNVNPGTHNNNIKQITQFKCSHKQHTLTNQSYSDLENDVKPGLTPILP
jgi:hypothetical protein